MQKQSPLCVVYVFGCLSLASVAAQEKKDGGLSALGLKVLRTALKWDEPAEPSPIVGPIYFVGTKGLGSF